jgi:hypothetical protein
LTISNPSLRPNQNLEAIIQVAGSCSSPSWRELRIILRGRFLQVFFFPCGPLPPSDESPATFPPVEDPAPECIVHWIVGVTTQAVVSHRRVQGRPKTVRTAVSLASHLDQGCKTRVALLQRRDMTVLCAGNKIAIPGGRKWRGPRRNRSLERCPRIQSVRRVDAA